MIQNFYTNQVYFILFKINAFRKNSHKIVLAHGTFDLLHVGHIKHFESAKKVGDKKRVLNVKLAKKNYIKNKINLSKGIFYTIDWYIKNKSKLESRYNYFAK